MADISKEQLKLQLLILRTQSGSESGFRELFSSFQGVTYQYLRSIVGEPDIQDVQQQVWFKVYQQLNKLSSPFGFKRWLMQITHRTAIDYLKSAKKYTELEDAADQAIESDINIEIPTNYEQLYEMLNTLSLAHKEVLLLHYWQEFSCVEIAQIIGCSSGTVKSRLFNARQQLQRLKSIQNY